MYLFSSRSSPRLVLSFFVNFKAIPQPTWLGSCCISDFVFYFLTLCWPLCAIHTDLYTLFPSHEHTWPRFAFDRLFVNLASSDISLWCKPSPHSEPWSDLSSGEAKEAFPPHVHPTEYRAPRDGFCQVLYLFYFSFTTHRHVGGVCVCVCTRIVPVK